MGARIALNRAFALYDSNYRSVPLEFSMAAIFPSYSRNLRGGGAAEKVAIKNRSSHCVRLGHCCRDRRFNVPHGKHLRVSAYMDLYRLGCSLVVLRIFVRQFRIWTVAPCGGHILCVSGDLSVYPDKRRSSQIQFFSRAA